MKLLFLLLTAGLAFAQDWGAVQRLQPNEKIEVSIRSGDRTKATFVSATADSVTVRDASGERSIAKADVRQMRVADSSRRIRNGLLWTAIGAGAGAGLGVAVCPGCANEGNGGKFVGPGVAVGAGLGALAFLPTPYRTVYKSR